MRLIFFNNCHLRPLVDPMLLVGFLLAICNHQAISQTNWAEGAFHIKSGKKYSNDQWMEFLPQEFDLFDSDNLLEITLESDFKLFIRNKNKDSYQEALLHFPLNDSTVVKRVVRIKPRGVFRKKYCAVPPIKLNFKHTEIYVKCIQQLEKMKMVSECKTSNNFEEYVLKEYLTYRLYQLFSDLSFKVRLIELTVKDLGSKKVNNSTGYAFLIEEVDDLAKRSKLQYLKIETASVKDIIAENMAIMALFNYMIGNTDWSIAGSHNVKLLKDTSPMEDKAYVVPYDFDYSGLVNASYAVPSENYSINSVRQRLFRCPCYSKEIFEKTIALFIAKKPLAQQIVQEFSYLSEQSKDDIEKFIAGFYKQIESKDAANFFLKNCGYNL